MNGELISENAVARGLTKIRELVAGWEPHPTFFEIATGLALLVISYLLVVLSELVPKAIALQYAAQVALLTRRPDLDAVAGAWYACDVELGTATLGRGS